MAALLPMPIASHAQLRSGPREQTETWPTATALGVARIFLPWISTLDHGEKGS